MGADQSTAGHERPARRRGKLGLGGSLALSAGIHAAVMGCGLLVVVGHAHRWAAEDPDTMAITLASVPLDPSWYQEARAPSSEPFAAARAEDAAPETLELEPPEVPVTLPVPFELEVEPPVRELEQAPLSDEPRASDVDWSELGSDDLADLRNARAPRGSIGAAAGVGSAGGGIGGVPGGGGARHGLARGPSAVPDLRPRGDAGAAAVVADASPKGDSRAPALLESPRPAYPRISLRLSEEGSVLVRIHVDADGRVSSVEVLESSGHERLDEAARAGVRSWRFEPALRDGVPVAGTYDHRIIFVIERAE